MKKTVRYYRSTLIVSFVVLSVFLLSKCISHEGKKDVIIKNAEGEQFAGSSTCASCHQNIYNTHIHTAHYLTSDSATDKYIKGNFETGKNTFNYNRSVVVAMEKRDDGFYQVEYYRGVEKKAKRMDIVVGSGTMGQSSLYWNDNYLFQLPITYFSAADEWSNSPGFPDKVVFNRVITSRCLECHSTYVKTISAPGKEPEEFDRNKIIYGVDCEKCHGPAAKHVQFQSQNPNETTAKFITNPAMLTRQQNLDLCALCHGGRLQKTKPSFEFTAGDTLSDYFNLDTSAPKPEFIDVHGNQYGLLRASKCFKMSTMTCNTCHDTHKNEKGQTALFSQRCITCHTEPHPNESKLQQAIGSSIKTNCIDCHMPVKSSRAIAVFLPGKSFPTAAQIRSHFISVYPDETQKLVDFMKSQKLKVKS